MINFKEALDSSSVLRSLYNKLLLNQDMEFWYSLTDDLEEYSERLANTIRNMLSSSYVSYFQSFQNYRNSLNYYDGIYFRAIIVASDSATRSERYLFGADNAWYRETNHNEFHNEISYTEVPLEAMLVVILRILARNMGRLSR